MGLVRGSACGSTRGGSKKSKSDKREGPWVASDLDFVL